MRRRPGYIRQKSSKIVCQGRPINHSAPTEKRQSIQPLVAATAVFYIQKGKVRLSVVSKTGKEATIGILGEGNFFGEGSLAGQAVRMGSAVSMTECSLLRIDKKAMMDALHREHAFSDMFVAYLLARNLQL